MNIFMYILLDTVLLSVISHVPVGLWPRSLWWGIVSSQYVFISVFVDWHCLVIHPELKLFLQQVNVLSKEGYVTSLSHIAVHHRYQEWWLRTLGVIHPPSIRHKTVRVNHWQEVLQYASCCVVHFRQQQALYDPVGVPVVEFSKPSTCGSVEAHIINVLQVTFTVCTKGGMKNLFWKQNGQGSHYWDTLIFIFYKERWHTALLISRATPLTPLFIPETAAVQWFTAYRLLYGTCIIWICWVYFILIQVSYAAYWQFWYNHQHSISLLYIFYGIYDVNNVTFQNSSVFWVAIIRANHILVIWVRSPWTLELIIEVWEEYTSSKFRAEVSQVGKVANCTGWEEGRIDLQEVEWPITTVDGEKGQGPNWANGKYRPRQWHNSQQSWPWRSDYKMAKDPEKSIYKILFEEPCRK